MQLTGMILAAGKGTRMKSDVPKGLHLVCGLPMVEHVIRALQGAGAKKSVLVIGHGADQMRDTFHAHPVEFALQAEQLGTGHAAMMAASLFKGYEGAVIVAPGDTPLLTADALTKLAEAHERAHALVTVASFIAADPHGYGRVVRDAKGHPHRIVEHKDASPEELKISEVNSSVYCFDAAALFKILPTLKNNNAQGEYYLTDVLRVVSESGGRTEAVVLPEELFMGVNDRWQLAEASTALKARILKHHAINGVTLIDPSTTWIGPEVTVGTDTVIEPNTVIEGRTQIGARCHLGPNSRIGDSKIGEGVTVRMSHVDHAILGDGSRIGPFANLRPGAVLGNGVKLGNFVEVKNSTLQDGVSAGHLSYLGDAEIGAGTNIGAGTITCNYDGYTKHQTRIGEDAFIGSNSTLVAPITIGDGAYVAAGSTITEDVSSDALALGRARQTEKEAWATRWREKNEPISSPTAN